MIAWLEYWDLQLFERLNGLHSPFWDTVMFTVSTKTFWIPCYVLLLFVMYRRWGWKTCLLVLATVALMITLSDQFASGFLKPTVQRFRPCRLEAGLDFAVHLVHNKCGGKYGFVSSHSANFFALATFLSLLFKRRKLSILFLSVAALVAYSRIYLGVHYPGDVIGGAMIGALSAYLCHFIFLFATKRLSLPYV